MGLLSGLEALGFRNTDVDIYEKKDDKDTSGQDDSQKKQNEFREEDVLFLKTYECPVCDETFKTLTVRAGKVRSAGHGDCLRPLYQDMDPLKYDVILCPHCGYGAVARYFTNVMPGQRKKLRAEVAPNFTGIKVSTDKFSYEEAIMRYKLALYSDVVMGVKSSRKAYTCLKMAWVIQGMLEEAGTEIDINEYTRLRKEEEECIQNAYDGYVRAVSSETFPMSGMDDITITFLLAELAYKLGLYQEALMPISRILGRANVSSRIKDQALELKEKVRAQMEIEKKSV